MIVIYHLILTTVDKIRASHPFRTINSDFGMGHSPYMLICIFVIEYEI